MNALLKKILMVTLVAASGTVVFGDPPKAAPAPPPKPEPARSVFVMPSGPHDGRDPFFPESNRPYEDAVVKHGGAVDATTIVVKGLSYEHGRPMVIINNHTFAVGDEGDVMTTGGRAHLRLAEIRTGTVVIEINGSRREIPIGVR